MPSPPDGRTVTLSGGDHFAWLGLRRVDGGGVAKHEGRYYDHGRPLGLHLAEVLEVLLEQGLLELADPSPDDGMSRANLTKAGNHRYTALREQQRAAVQVPAPEHVTITESPAGRRSRAASGGQPDPIKKERHGVPDAAVFEWMALRRVHGGGVVHESDGYLDHGRVVVGDVSHALARLIAAGCLVLGPPRPNGVRPVCVTVAGQRHYTELQEMGSGG